MLKDEFTEAQLQSFYDEAEVIAQVPVHEFIVGFLGCVGDPFMIITEFCGQGSLHRFLRSSTTDNLQISQLLSIARDVAIGMAHLAQHKIVHREYVLPKFRVEPFLTLLRSNSLACRNILLTNELAPKISDCKIFLSLLSAVVV
jgi:serine/threonine protein kinase